MALKADEFIIVMMSLAIGTGIGAAMDIDGAFSRFGEKSIAAWRRDPEAR